MEHPMKWECEKPVSNYHLLNPKMQQILLQEYNYINMSLQCKTTSQTNQMRVKDIGFSFSSSFNEWPWQNVKAKEEMWINDKLSCAFIMDMREGVDWAILIAGAEFILIKDCNFFSFKALYTFFQQLGSLKKLK